MQKNPIHPGIHGASLWSSSCSSAAPPPPRSALRRTPRTFSRPSRFTCSNAPTPKPLGARTYTQTAHSCTLHKSCSFHMPGPHSTSTHTNHFQHSAAHQSFTTHLAPSPTLHAFATASNKHTKPVLPLTLPTGNLWPLTHAHTAIRTRAAHDIHTHPARPHPCIPILSPERETSHLLGV